MLGFSELNSGIVGDELLLMRIGDIFTCQIDLFYELFFILTELFETGQLKIYQIQIV